MVKGIGIDMVSISDMERLLSSNDSFIRHTFTKNEIIASQMNSHPAEYLATRFACKEAVFKAVAPLTKEKSFDFRIVETLNNNDGSPYINITKELQIPLTEAGVSRLLVSISTEKEFAIAFVEALED